MHHLQHISELGPLFAEHGIRQVVISPGSRNAPLIQLFTSSDAFKCHSIVDERSAAYLALGMVRQLREPVILLCTSGTAVFNYAPAMAEAFRQRLPLVVLSADRPREYPSQFNNQVCEQEGAYGRHVVGYFGFTEAFSHPSELREALKEVNRLLELALKEPSGPVHFNLPLQEPLYVPLPGLLLKPEGQVSDAQEAERQTSGDHQEASFRPDWLSGLWTGEKKVLILAGMGNYSRDLPALLERLQDRTSTVVVAENLSNLGQAFISSPQLVLTGASAEERKELCPDLVLSFGGQVVSKALRLFLQSRDKPDMHEIPHSEMAVFMDYLHTRTETPGEGGKGNNYLRLWQRIENREARRVRQEANLAGFGNLAAMLRIHEALPGGYILHLGNSATVRFAQLQKSRSDLHYYANRGTSGIDGSLSSAVGAAMVSDRRHLLIIGDLSFVYDSNGLWNKSFPDNLKIIVLNDGGGGIFRLLDGPGRMAFFEEFSVTHHPVSLELLAAAYGRGYMRVRNLEELDRQIQVFLKPGKAYSVMEVDTTHCENSRIFKQIFKSPE